MPSDYFATLAGYNAWANQRLYAACERLSEDEYLRERRSAFGSLHATLNHLLVADRIWLARIAGRNPPLLAATQILYADLVGLKVARQAEDEHLRNLIAGLSPASLDRPLVYRNGRGDRCETRLSLALGHMFNQQAHYRGEVSAMLAQTEIPPPPLDLIQFVGREEGAPAC